MQNLEMFGFLLPIGILLLLYGIGLKNKEKLLIWVLKKFKDTTDGYTFKTAKGKVIITHPNLKKAFAVRLPSSEIVIQIIIKILPLFIVLMVGYFIIKQVTEAVGVSINQTGNATGVGAITDLMPSMIPIMTIGILVAVVTIVLNNISGGDGDRF
jgi:hypothetical protein